MLGTITDYLQSFPFDQQGVDHWQDDQAAVLIALTRDSADPSVILTKRAEHLNSHRGEVAFPGGKRDREDKSLLHTALRETHEEVGLKPACVDVIARLPVQNTRFEMLVTPFVGVVDPDVTLIANEGELDAVFQVPVSYFLDQSNLTKDLFTGRDYSLTMPCYIFEGFRIWGFTLGLLVDLLNSSLDAGIKLHYPDFRVDGKTIRNDN